MHKVKTNIVNHVMLLVIIVIVSGCTDHQQTWDRIIQSGELRFATTAGPATYYETPSGPAGFEYELANKFAEKIGVKLKLVTTRNGFDVISMITNNKAAIGGASLITSNVPADIKFGPGYYSVPQQLIYRRGDIKPADLSELHKASLDVSAEQVDTVKNIYPQISLNTYYDKDVNTLLRMVQSREIKSTIASSYLVNMYKHLYPDIRVAFNITKPQPVAWVYKSNDDKLDEAIKTFFSELDESGELDRLVDRYFGHMIAFDYIDTSTFLTRIEKRLPQYEKLFKKIAEKYNLDWTLLAAMSYQESHWHASAKSPTGVRGLMMLTQDTAAQIGVEDRTDPEQSIDGGARYFMMLVERIPERITRPDRTWLALAAYNVGLQHLEYARVVTQKNGGNPDNWNEVRKTLIQLGEEHGEKVLKSSEVRWYEPVRYVRNIRKYRDILRWLDFENTELTKKSELVHVLSIDSPVL